MSNTSTNKTANKPTKSNKDKDKLRVIVGEIGRDTKTGILGRGYSNDNGKTFHVTDTMYGRLYGPNDIDGIWNGGTADRVKNEVDSATAEIPAAVSAANSAVSAAESAVAASKVNSDAIVAQSEAISEAKSAMDSATAEIQQTAANAASDAAKIRADVARVQNEVDTAKAANSASVEALKSDVSAAKQGLADVHDSLTKAQSAIEQNQKLINDNVAKITSDVSATKQDLATVHDSLTKAQAAAEQNQKAINDSIAEINANVDATNQDLAGVRKDLTKAQSDITANQKAVNDNVAQINSDIEQDRKDIASAQQANADTAKQLDTYSKQATEQGKTIKTIQDKQDGFTATLADVQGNVSQVSDKVDGLSASLKDAQGNVASVKAQADQLSATLTDHAKSIATLTASAKELSSTLEDAGGRLSKVEQTAQDNSSTLADVQGDLSQVKQNATKLVSTLKDAQGNISTLQQKADSLSTQLASAQGDIATLQTGIDGVKAILTSHDKSIHTLQADSKSLKDSMVNAQGDISTLRKTATDVTSELEDHTGRLSKVEQSAAKQATTLSDLQGNLTQVKQRADGLVTTLKDAQGSITQIQQKADGTLAQLKSAQGDIASLQTDVTGIKATLTDHEGDIHTLQADSKMLKDDMQDVQGDISTLKQTSTDVTSELKDHAGRISKTEQTASTLVNELADQQGHLNRVEQTAQGTQQTVANQQGQINTIKTDTAGIHETLTGQGNQIANINVTLNGLNSKYEGVSGDLGKLKNSAMQNRGTVSAPDFNSLTAAGFYTITVPSRGKNYPTGSWGTLEVSGQTSDSNGRLNQKYVSDNNAETYVRQYNANTKSWTAWIKAANQNDVTALSNRITTNSTQIDQNKNSIALKADQSTVDSLSGEVSQNKAQLKVQADQISSKVSGIETSLADANSKINDITSSGGGRNLWIDSKSFQHTITNAPKVGWNTDSDGMVTAHITGTGGFYGQWQNIYANNTEPFAIGDSATFSVEMKGTGTITIGREHDFEKAVTLTNTWTRYSVSGVVKDANRAHIIYNESGKDCDAYVRLPMVEKGIIAHDWQPAPEDTNAKITANSTAIDQTNQQISLKADQTEVDQIKNTASQNSSRLDVMAGEIKSKVTSTDVNNIVDGKGYATTSTVQSLITQKAGTINESITNLTSEMNTRNGVNLLKGTKDFSGSWHNYGSTNCWHTENWIDPNGNHSVKSDSLSWYGYYQPIYLDTGDYTFSGYYYSEGGKPVFCYIRPNSGDNLVEVSYNSNLDSTPNGWRWFVVHFKVTKAGNAAVRLESGQNQILHIASYKLERGTVTKPVWTPAPSDNATVTQIQQITASIDGLQSTVANKADKSQITQLSNLVQSKVSTSDFTSKVSQLSNDINARVTKGDLLSQINLEAGQTLIQSKKIFLDADTVAFSGKAFIPSAAITSLDADKITSGYIKVPMSDGNGNSVQVSNNGVDILSNNKESKLFNANRGIASVHIDAAGMGFGATTNGAYEQLGALSVLLDNTDGSYEGMTNHNGIGYVVETQQQYGYPYGGDFFSLARSIKGPPSYYNGFLYEATGSGKHEIGSHFFDPIWIHPWGADNYMHATWVSWTAWDNNEKYPAIVQAGSNMGGICFPKSGEVTLFTASGKSFTPSQWKGVYTDYEHAGAGQSYLDPSYGA